MMITIIDYGMGNLRSVQKALEKVGAQTRISQQAQDIKNADKVVLPGVGAMKPAMEKLESLELIPAIKEAITANKPFLGICVGFQLLFERSDEGGNAKGLGIFQGDVGKFESVKIPQIGWNQLNIQNTDCAIFKDVVNLSNVYFCHSYFAKPADANIIATTTEYGINFASAVWKDNLFGVQFHPEKSQTVGLKILENFHKLGSPASGRLTT